MDKFINVKIDNSIPAIIVVPLYMPLDCDMTLWYYQGCQRNNIADDPALFL